MNLRIKNKLSVISIAMVGFYGTISLGGEGFESRHNEPKSLTITMTNTSTDNAIQVYDSISHALLQTLPTQGKGGLGGSARGVKGFANKILAVANNGSSDVSIFERLGNSLRFVKTVETTSPPVSIDFANDHMYVAGNTSIDSFLMEGTRVIYRDGTVNLLLAEGGLPQSGNTSQVGAFRNQVLVTIKTDPTPGTVDVIALDKDGAVNGPVKAVAGPANSLTPFGFTITGPDSALITLAHSGQVGLFRDGAFTSVITSGGQAGPCWSARVGKYVLIVNAGSKTLSREVATGNNLFIDSSVAVKISSGGGPTDIDVNGSFAAVVDSSSTTSHLNFFTVNSYGEMQADGDPIDLGTPKANGVAVMAPLY